MPTATIDQELTRMARRKGTRPTVMVRVYVEFADKVKRASAERGLTAADFCEQLITPCVDKAHRDHIEAEAKKLGKGPK